MKYPVGTILHYRTASERADEICVRDPNYDWGNDWKRVGEAKYDPEPLKIGQTYLYNGVNAAQHRVEIIGLHSHHENDLTIEYVWFKYLDEFRPKGTFIDWWSADAFRKSYISLRTP